MQRKQILLALTVVVFAIITVAYNFISSQEFQLPDDPAETARGASEVYMATGIKIGEVTDNSAIIWTRLTRNPATAPKTKWGPVINGNHGEVRILYWPSDNQGLQRETAWYAVDAERDFTHQMALADLIPATDYSVLVEGRPLDNSENVYRLDGHFRTAPGEGSHSRVYFAVVTCQEYGRLSDKENGYAIYNSMNSMDLDFLVHTGDNVYYDQPKPYATNLALARFKWSRNYSLPFTTSFFNQTSSYFMKDDHDTLKNDSFPGQTYGDISWHQGLELFREQVPMGENTYRTIRWGKDLQIWMVEGRDFRSPNDMPDGPSKTIWGSAQKKWFFDSVQKSEPTFRLLISPTPIVGPDHGKKLDNHANPGFKTEGDEIRVFVGSQKNMFIISGDRHWQYVSKDPETGAIEFGGGPAIDELAHDVGERDRSPMHRYLNFQGGFLTVEVARQNEVPHITFKHHAVDGSINNEEVFSP